MANTLPDKLLAKAVENLFFSHENVNLQSPKKPPAAIIIDSLDDESDFERASDVKVEVIERQNVLEL